VSQAPSPAERQAARRGLAEWLYARTDALVEAARTLVGIPSATPPGDTNAAVEAVRALVSGEPAIETVFHRTAPHVANVVLRVRGNRPGRRLVLNGHLDTFPLGDPAQWTADPCGEVRDGRVYGLGICDMKGGVPASLFALLVLSQRRDAWVGEIVGTFVGDEETMGLLGTQALQDTVPHARGDAMISADVGSARVLRFGEKGFVWLNITAESRSAHAAHVHRGVSAIERLAAVMARIAELRAFPVAAPPAVTEAIEKAASLSEPLSGLGETAVLRSVTVTFGTIKGGRLRNLVADHAEATADIRISVGVALDDILAAIRKIGADADGARIVVERSFEATWTDPRHPIVRSLASACAEALGAASVATMRVGASDARLYRRAGVPSVVCGLTPNNMDAPDEYAEIRELSNLALILTLAAFDYLIV
jgi:succinyl-diaminopimelate desuccinylase